MQSYDSVAFELLAGLPSPWHAFRPVGYSALLALVYRLTDGSHTFVGVLQALMSAALVPWVAYIARAAGATRVVAGGVALLVALSLPLVFYSGLVLTEVPTAFCLLLALKQALAPAAEERDLWRWAKIGLCLGVAGAMRPNLLLIAPLLAAYIGLRRARAYRALGARGLAAGSVAALSVLLALALPVTLVSSYNSRVLGRRAGPAANGGLNFYLNFVDARSVHYEGRYGGYWISPVPNGLRYTRDELSHVPFFDESHYYKEGLRFVRQHPEALLRALDNFHEASGLGRQLYWPNWPGYEALFRRYAQLFFALVLVPGLAFLGVVGVQGLRRRARSEALLLAGVCVLGTLPMYFFLGDPRVRVPFDPVWVVLAGLLAQALGGALWRLWCHLRSARRPASQRT
jgi:4-amino-4-deoxy-L-arabinose transferase-like glycosyltransferase